MPGATLDSLIQILQDNFGKRVHSVANDRVNIYNRIPEEMREFDGKQIVEAVTASYPASFMALGPNAAALPTPSSTAVKQTNIYHVYYYASIRVDWDLAAQSAGNHAFVKARVLELERAMKYMLVDLERQMLGNGDCVLNPSNQTGTDAGTGLRNIGTVTAASWTFTIDNYDAVNFQINRRVEFFDGLTGADTVDLDFHTQAAWEGSTKRDVPTQGYYTISNVEPNTATGGGYSATLARITIAEASPNTNPPINGDYVVTDESIVVANGPSSKNTSNELVGLKAVIHGGGNNGSDSIAGTSPTTDTANQYLVTNTKAGFAALDTFQNLDASTNGWWKAVELNFSGGFLDQPKMDQLGNRMIQHSATPPEDIAFYTTHQNQIGKFRESLFPQERYPVTDGSPSLPTGAQSSFNERNYLTFANKPIIPSRFCSPTRVFAVNTTDIHRYTLVPFNFKPWHQDFGGRPADQADAMCIMNVGATNRNGSGLISGLTKP